MTSIEPSRGGAATAVLLTLIVAVGSLLAARPPEAIPASAERHLFSSERALEHVEAIASAVHPMGSAAHAEVRAYLLDELAALGLETEEQIAWAGRARGAGVFAARVHNVLARLQGESDGPALALMSHYDSVPTGPGAGDAAAGVAAILETVRALRAGDPLPNDLIVVITDGEEAGLLGARAFADEHPWISEIGLVLNFEARGNAGLVTMFETSDGNSRLVREMARAAPYPWASSLSYEVYRRMPNDTDLTVTRGAGLPGLNFAMIGNHAAYHTDLDTLDALDRRSLQHMGSYALSLARRFGEIDLTFPPVRDAVYFNPLGTWLLVYSLPTARGLAVLAVAIMMAAFWVARRRDSVTLGALGKGLLAGLGLLLVCALLMGSLWNLLEQLFPAILAAPHGDPYAAMTILVGFLAIALAMAMVVAGLAETLEPIALQLGVLSLWTVLTVALVVVVPGASYLTLWPALVGGLALVGCILFPGRVRWRRAGLSALGLLTAALIFPPVVRLVAEALSVTAAPVQGLVLALPLTLLLPQLQALTRSHLSGPIAAAGIGLALLGWVGWTAGPTAETPATTSLYYALDGETGEAIWISHDLRPDDWTSQAIPSGTAPGPLPDFLPGRPGLSVFSSSAPAANLAAPAAELVSDVFEKGVRTLELRVRSVRGATWLTLVPDAAMATVTAMGVANRLFEIDSTGGQVAMTLQNVPPEGVEVSLRMIDRQPMKIDLLDTSFGLPLLDGGTLEPRPATLIRSTRWSSDTTRVRGVFWF